MEKIFKKCRWYDIKLESIGRNGTIIYIPEINKNLFIPIKNIKEWFTYKRQQDKKTYDNLIKHFYQFEKQIK